MNVRSIVIASALIAAVVPALAQPAASQAPRGDTPAAAPAARTPAPAPRREGQPVNIKIDFTITDQRGTTAPAIKRTLTMLVADERTGSIRSQSAVYQVGDVPLNIDASPTLLTDGKIRLGFNLQYDWPAPFEGPAATQQPPRGTVIKTQLHDSVTLILESGKPMIAAQSADPIGDRQVTVELKATVLR